MQSAGGMLLKTISSGNRLDSPGRTPMRLSMPAVLPARTNNHLPHVGWLGKELHQLIDGFGRVLAGAQTIGLVGQDDVAEALFQVLPGLGRSLPYVLAKKIGCRALRDLGAG